jgi:hypothetical protein
MMKRKPVRIARTLAGVFATVALTAALRGLALWLQGPHTGLFHLLRH